MCHTVLSMRSSHTFHEGQTKMGLCLEKLHRRKVCYQKNFSVVYPKDSSSTNQRDNISLLDLIEKGISSPTVYHQIINISLLDLIEKGISSPTV